MHYTFFQEELGGYRVDYNLAFYIVAVLEYIAADILKVGFSQFLGGNFCNVYLMVDKKYIKFYKILHRDTRPRGLLVSSSYGTNRHI